MVCHQKNQRHFRGPRGRYLALAGEKCVPGYRADPGGRTYSPSSPAVARASVERPTPPFWLMKLITISFSLYSWKTHKMNAGRMLPKNNPDIGRQLKTGSTCFYEEMKCWTQELMKKAVLSCEVAFFGLFLRGINSWKCVLMKTGRKNTLHHKRYLQNNYKTHRRTITNIFNYVCINFTMRYILWSLIVILYWQDIILHSFCKWYLSVHSWCWFIFLLYYP